MVETESDDWASSIKALITGRLTFDQDYRPYSERMHERERILWINDSTRRMSSELSCEEPGASLSLLALLGQIDGNRWQEKIESIFADEVTKQPSIGERIDHIRWNNPLIGVDVTLTVNGKHEVQERLCALSCPSLRHEERYAALEDELAELCTIRRQSLSEIDLRTPVRLYCEGSESVPLSEFLAEAHLMVFAQHSFHLLPPSRHHSQRDRMMRNSRLRIHEVCINENAYVMDLDWSAILYLKSILECGVRVYNFVPFYIEDPETLRDDEVLDAFEVLFPFDNACIGIEELKTSSESTPELTEALYSSLRFCHTVRYFEFCEWSKEQSRKHWQWLAYALFCRGARHQISHVELSVYGSTIDVTAMREIVDASNPLAILYGGDPSSKPGGQVHTRRFHLRDPAIDLGGRSIRIYQKAVIADVITSGNEENEWWEVLLPGYGRAWVYPEDIERHVEHDQLPVAHRISTMKNFATHATIDDVTDVIDIIGSSLISVFNEYNNHKTDQLLEPQDIDRIMAACPRLEDLHLPSLKASPECLRAIADSACHRGRRFQGIEISVCPSGDLRSLIDFFTILGDENHPLTVHLKELRVAVRLNREEDMGFMDALVAMLALNQSLVKFTLVVDENCLLQSQRASIGARLFPGRERGHEPFYTIDAPIRLKCRLAFLSVLASTRN